MITNKNKTFLLQYGNPDKAFEIHDTADMNKHLIRKRIMENPLLRDEHIDRLISYGGSSLAGLANHPNLKEHHIHKILDGYPSGDFIQTIAYRKGTLSKSVLDKLVNMPDSIDREITALRKDLHPDHIDKLVRDNHRSVRSAIATSQNLKPEHIDVLSNDYDQSIRWNLARNHNLNSSHIDNLVNHHTNYNVARSYVEKHIFSDEQYEKLKKNTPMSRLELEKLDHLRKISMEKRRKE